MVYQTPNDAPCRPGIDFCVLIVCEYNTTAKACEILQLLRNNLKAEEGRLLYQTWNIDALAFHQDREEMIPLQSVKADMIIFGFHENQELANQILAWVKQWAPLRKKHSGALVLVVDPDAENRAVSEEIIKQFQQAATLWKMDFFVTQANGGRMGAAESGTFNEVARQIALTHHLGVLSGLPGTTDSVASRSHHIKTQPIIL